MALTDTEWEELAECCTTPMYRSLLREFDDLNQEIRRLRASAVGAADALHKLALRRIEALMGAESEPELLELKEWAEVVEAYEGIRWPIGVVRRIPGYGGMDERE